MADVVYDYELRCYPKRFYDISESTFVVMATVNPYDVCRVVRLLLHERNTIGCDERNDVQQSAVFQPLPSDLGVVGYPAVCPAVVIHGDQVSATLLNS